MGVAGKLANAVSLPITGASDAINAGAGAARNVLRRSSTLLGTLGKRINRTAARIIRGGGLNMTKKNKNKNKNRKNKSKKNKH
jgi:hypothetical protein